jgi:hypothetical protein
MSVSRQPSICWRLLLPCSVRIPCSCRRFVDGFDSVDILNCELGVVWCLGVVVDDTVPNLSTLSKSSLALGSVVE